LQTWCKRAEEPTSFEPHSRAAIEVDELYRGELSPPSIERITEWAGGERMDEWYIADDELRLRFCDALIDIARFIEEIRFEIAFGALLIWDWDARLADGDVAKPEQAHAGMPIPIEALALITSYMTEPPPPTRLVQDPYQTMSGSRVLSQWLAGQVFDMASAASSSTSV
jgi:hypothetical protein